MASTRKVVVKTPDGVAFMITSTLSLEQIKALAEGLVLAKKLIYFARNFFLWGGQY